MTHIHESVREKYPGLFFLAFTTEIEHPREVDLEPIFQEIKKMYSLEKLTENSIIQAYRKFFWSQKIDPTKERVSSEAIIRRILSRKGLPKIHPVVDIYNAFSGKYLVPISGFNMEKITGDITVRFAEHNEKFVEIGGKKELLLGREVILSDEEKILSIYAHKDSEFTKITDQTKEYMFVLYGVPGIEVKHVENLFDEFSEFLVEHLDAKMEKVVLVG